MKAIVVNKLSTDINTINYQDVPEVKLDKKGDVLVQVKASGLNFYDLLMVEGRYQIKQEPPFILGTEFSGIVLASNSNRFKVGDRVFGSKLGAYVERLVINENGLIPLPDKVSFDQGAGLFITYPTALAGLKLRAGLKNGETILIHGSTGGVGIPAIKISKLLGATVIATGTDDNKLNIAKSYGADHVINIKKLGSDWPKEVLKLTSNKGVDVVYDPVGLINASLKCIAFSGKAVIVGFAIGKHEKLDTNRILLKNISIVGLHWGAYAKFEPKTIKLIWSQLLDWLSKGDIEPLVYPKVYHVSKTAEALSLLKDRKAYAKVVVRVGEDQSKL